MTPVSADLRRQMKLAAELIRKSCHEAEGGMAHRLAFGRGNGRSCLESFGMANFLFTEKTIAAIQRYEREKFGRKIGLRPRRKEPASTVS